MQVPLQNIMSRSDNFYMWQLYLNIILLYHYNIENDMLNK